MEEYRTVKSEACGFLEVKRSKFYGYACPVTTRQESDAFVEKIRTRHWDARHNVPAFILREGNLQHFSDDGEPSGTAGRPVLHVLQGAQVTNVCVVITRYFGGVLLGTGGLVRAYSESARLALEEAEIVTMRLMARCSLHLDYGLYGRLPAMIAEQGGVLEVTEFGEDVAARLLLPTDNVDQFNRQLQEYSSGKYAAEVLEEEFCPVEN